LTHGNATSLRVLDDSLTFGSPPSPNRTDAITPPTNPTKCFTTARDSFLCNNTAMLWLLLIFTTIPNNCGSQKPNSETNS
ncbi:hypothetical protein NEUTE1DRAFT_52239, partial [Neurospora tetrasperma FGSC 2508]